MKEEVGELLLTKRGVSLKASEATIERGNERSEIPHTIDYVKLYAPVCMLC